MNCESYRTLLSGHLDGVNTKTEEESLQSHLKTCADCRALMDILTKNDEILKNDAVQVPENLTERIMQRVRTTPQKKKSKRKWVAAAASSLAAAAVLAVVFFGKNALPSLNRADTETTTAPEAVAAKEVAPEDANSVQTYALAIPKTTVAGDETEKRKTVVTETAVLIVRADHSQIELSGELLSPTEAKELLDDMGLSADGATAAYLVSFEELQRIEQTYGGTFEMEKKYSERMEYQTALVLLVQ